MRLQAQQRFDSHKGIRYNYRRMAATFLMTRDDAGNLKKRGRIAALRGVTMAETNFQGV